MTMNEPSYQKHPGPQHPPNRHPSRLESAQEPAMVRPVQILNLKSRSSPLCFYLLPVIFAPRPSHGILRTLFQEIAPPGDHLQPMKALTPQITSYPYEAKRRKIGGAIRDDI